MSATLQTIWRCLCVVLAMSFFMPDVRVRRAVQNTNPNYTAIHEFGRIEWHGNSASLIAGGSRPLDMAAVTLSTCLGVSVSSEEPQYRYMGDLLDVTAPQWSARHPESRAYAAKPGKLEITFGIYRDGSATDLDKLLRDAARQINQQQPFAYQVYERQRPNRSPYSSFVPTRTHDENGVVVEAPAYLDRKITIPRQTNTIANFAAILSGLLSRASGMDFGCCQSVVGGQLWGTRSVTYHASDLPARDVLEDLMDRTHLDESYSLRCQPLGRRSCIIEVHPVLTQRKPKTDGVCAALGYDGQ